MRILIIAGAVGLGLAACQTARPIPPRCDWQHRYGGTCNDNGRDPGPASQSAPAAPSAPAPEPPAPEKPSTPDKPDHPDKPDGPGHGGHHGRDDC